MRGRGFAKWVSSVVLLGKKQFTKISKFFKTYHVTSVLNSGETIMYTTDTLSSWDLMRGMPSKAPPREGPNIIFVQL